MEKLKYLVLLSLVGCSTSPDEVLNKAYEHCSYRSKNEYSECVLKYSIEYCNKHILNQSNLCKSIRQQ
jgi:hypothetical protein